jgi:hypothetical protein
MRRCGKGGYTQGGRSCEFEPHLPHSAATLCEKKHDGWVGGGSLGSSSLKIFYLFILSLFRTHLKNLNVVGALRRMPAHMTIRASSRLVAVAPLTNTNPF